MNAGPGGPGAPVRLARHTLVWPSPAAYADLRPQGVDAEARAAIARWQDAAWPLVVRRPEPPATPSVARVHLGLPLPPAQGKRRLAFALARNHIARTAPPPSLAWVSAALPAPWQRPLAALDRDARSLGVTLRVFGSAAWQALTGLAYLREDSDVDLLFHPDTAAQLDATLALFDGWEAGTGRRIDAEIVFAGERAVAWREWRQASRADDRVLVKSLAGVALLPRADLRILPAPVAA